MIAKKLEKVLRSIIRNIYLHFIRISEILKGNGIFNQFGRKLKLKNITTEIDNQFELSMLEIIEAIACLMC